MKKNKYLVEFVSANPTGPLHVGHCRGALLEMSFQIFYYLTNIRLKKNIM